MVLPLQVSRNGVLVPPAQASVSVFNPAIYGAFGVYESMQVENGIVFALEPHLQRLRRSAHILELSLPADLATFERWIDDVLHANGAADCTLRLFVVGGEDGGEPVAYIWPQPSITYPASFYMTGAPAITFAGARFWPQAKSINTLVSYLARRRAQAAGAHEGLLYHHGRLTEGANSNLFAVLDGEVVTPPADQVLSGVTRDFLLALGARNGITIHEASLALADMSRWTECFISSTSRHVMPITMVDGHPVGDGQVGPVTRRLSALFEHCYGRATTPGGGAPSSGSHCPAMSALALPETPGEGL